MAAHAAVTSAAAHTPVEVVGLQQQLAVECDRAKCVDATQLQQHLLGLQQLLHG